MYAQFKRDHPCGYSCNDIKFKNCEIWHNTAQLNSDNGSLIKANICANVCVSKIPTTPLNKCVAENAILNSDIELFIAKST